LLLFGNGDTGQYKDYDTILDEDFWHIEVEQFPNIAETYKPKFLLTNFVLV
jgi:hypothetical protein